MALPWGKILAKALAWTLVLAALAACAGLLSLWVLADSDWGRARLRAYLEEEVARQTGGRLVLEGISGNIFHNLILEGLSLERQGRRPLSVERAELDYNPLALLLGRRLSLGRLTLLRPRLELPLDLAPSPGGGGGLSLSLSVSDLEVREGSLSAGGQLGALQRVSGLNLSGHFSLDSRGPVLAAEIKDAQLEMTGLAAPLGVEGQATLAKERLRLPGLSLRLGSNQLRVQGQVDWRDETELKLKAGGALADLTVFGPPAWLPGRPATPLEVRLEAQGSLTACRFEAQVSRQEQRLLLKGSLNTQRPALELEGQCQGVDLLAWGLSPQPAILEGRLDLNAQGLPGQPGASARLGLDLSNPLGPELGLRRLLVEAGLQGDQIKVESFKLSGEAGQVEGSASLLLPQGRRPMALQAELSFKDLTPPPLLAGSLPEPWRLARLQGKLKARGSSEDLGLDLELGPSRLATGLEITSLAALGGRAGGRWVLNSLDLAAEGMSLKGQGNANQENAALDFSLEVGSLERLVPLWTALGWQPPAQRGSLSAKGRLAGPWGAPGLSLTVQAGNLALPQAFVRRLDLDLDTPRLGLPLAGRLRLGVQDLEGGGIAWNKASLEASAEADGLRLALAAQGPQLGLSLKASGVGAARLPLKLQLGELRLTPAGQKTWALREPAQLSLASDGMSLRGVVLAQGEQTLALEGQVAPGGALNASLNLQELRPGTLLPAGLLPAEARLDSQARLGGTLAAPSLELRGRLRDLRWPHLPPSEVAFQGGYGDGRLSLSGQALTQGRPSLDLEASLGLKVSLQPPLLEPTAAGLKASARARDLPLALLGPAIPGVGGLEGLINLEATASGPLGSPQVTGSLDLTGGAFLIPSTGQAFQDLVIHLTARGREITVREISAKSNGPAKVRGKVLLPIGDDGQVDLSFQAQRLLIGMGGIGKVITDADFHITGTAMNPVATGWTKPSHAVIHPGLASPLALGEVVVLAPGQEPPPLGQDRGSRAPRIVLGGPLKSLTLDGLVDLGRGVRVDLDQGFMLLSGVARVRKAPAGPLVFYQSFKVDGGAMYIVGRRFVLAGGQTMFAGKEVPDPDLDVNVNLRMGSIQFYINLKGSAFSPKLVLSSEPPMSQTDILSTIIFGRPAQSLNAGETRQLSAQALALLGLRGRDRLESVLGPALSPDVVTVHTEVQTGSSLEAGKYLSQDIYLRYRQNLGPDGGQNVGLEYRFNPHLSVESQIGTTRDSGVDAVFTWDFK